MGLSGYSTFFATSRSDDIPDRKLCLRRLEVIQRLRHAPRKSIRIPFSKRSWCALIKRCLWTGHSRPTRFCKMDTVLTSSSLSHQTNHAPGVASHHDENNRTRASAACAFPYAHHNLVREIEILERTLIDERRMRRQLDIRYTTLILDIAVWALSRLEMDYQFRVNNGGCGVFMSANMSAHTFLSRY